MDEQPNTGSTPALRTLGVANIVTNVAIVVTGGAVRLTESGLGCPNWPTCTGDSIVPTTGDTSMWHQAIEFGNRIFAFVVLAAAVAAFVAARRHRPRDNRMMRLAYLLVGGVVAQGVVGGITVLTGLHPLIVATHFLLSTALISVAVLFNDRVHRPTGRIRVTVHPHLRQAQGVLLAVLAVVIAIGTLVTASGPHPGDAGTPRLPLDPEVISRVHADGVFLVIGLTLALWFALRATSAPPETRRAAAILLGVELAQGTIGYVQYFTGLPEILVGAHLLGACLVWIAALHLWVRSTDIDVEAADHAHAPAASTAGTVG